MPWKKGIAVGRAYELLRADLLTHLTICQREIGFEFCRFHALFHDEMAVVRRDATGNLVYQWRFVDEIFDRLRSVGLRPFVELNPMPSALASGKQRMFWYGMNVTPPRDMAEWSELVSAFARHCIDRYGRAEVRQWYFEVWNEPNLGAFWAGSQADYFELYAASARALTAVDPELRVGGPATASARWIPELIEHCGRTGTPLDFVSTHTYAQDEFVQYPDRAASPHDPGEFFADAFRRVQREVADSARPDLEIHWTEWNTQQAHDAASVTWSHNRSVDALEGGSFVARECVALDGTCDSMFYWVASDLFEEGGPMTAPFSQTYGLLTMDGLPKATFNAMRLLARMRGDRLKISELALAHPGCGAVATREGVVTRLLLWNHPIPGLSAANWSVDVSLPGEQWFLVRVTAGAGSPFERWLEMGQPQNLSPVAREALAYAAVPSVAVVSPMPDYRLEVGPGEVVWIEARPMESGKQDSLDKLAELEVQLGQYGKVTPS